MAAFASGREIRARVIDGSLGVVVVGLVARNAGRYGDVVVVVDVAVGAGARGHGVLAG